MVFETAESISRSVDLNEFKSILGLGMNTDFEPIGKNFMFFRKISRMSLLALFLFTALPNRLDVIIPNLGICESSLSKAICNQKLEPICLTPFFFTNWNSQDFRNLVDCECER